eukprot:TRINITY_DN8946_c0_g1_i7.p1 TRINITY_DN8946_c0_g1~~TRINITY_DN8946_c0_g1_i7.p1  ORF type:complete len:182 (+),score=40.49 TRINITY_DN8946_c0_g1_i7:74-619(+)
MCIRDRKYYNKLNRRLGETKKIAEPKASQLEPNTIPSNQVAQEADAVPAVAEQKTTVAEHKPSQQQLSLPMNFGIPNENPRLRAELLQHIELIESLEGVLRRLHEDQSDPLLDIELTQAGNLLNSISVATKGICPISESVPELHQAYTTLITKLNAANMLLSALSPQLKDKTYSRYLGCLL